MTKSQIIQIVKEEMSEAETRIIQRLSIDTSVTEDSNSQKPLPDNENYAKALNSYLAGGTHSGTAKELGVSMAQVKKYYTWLVNNGYLPIEKAELSETELRVVNCIFERKMSLREAAQELGCSVSNVTYRRDSALRKGYKPKDPEE